jgi:cell division protein FtsQ
MARRGGSAIQEELYSTPDEPAREELDDARLLDLDAEKESPFLRAQKRVPVRRGPLPKKTAAKLLWAFAAIIVAALGAVGAAALYHYGEHSWRFRLQSSDDIEMAGLSNVTRAQVMEVMGADIGRNVFYISLDQRQKQLEQIPWVESASVMRFAPNRIKVEIHERAPVAFARIGSKISLIDASGVLMELSTKKKYSFPVIIGMNSGEPLSTRAPRMKIYNELVRELDSGGGHYSQDLSEVDLSDPEDVKVLTNDPDGEVLVHLGSGNYLQRFKIYVAHLREWREQFSKLESVDLRYDRQIVVNPDLEGAARQPALSAAMAKAAMAAGVKPAALVGHDATSSLHASVVPTLSQRTRKDGATSTVKTVQRTYVVPTPSQKTRRDGTPSAGIKPAGVKPAPKRPLVRHSIWQKKSAVKAKVPLKSAVQRSPVVLKPQAAPAPQKPSPAILKGQATH